MQMIRGVLLDVDGTLVDSNDAHANSWVEAFAEAGVTVSFAEVRRLIGKGGDKLLPEVSGIPEDSPKGKEVSRRKGEIFRKNHLPHVRAFLGARALLERMRAAGLGLAVATSGGKKDLKPLLALDGIGELIEVRVTKDDAAKSKPDADIIRATLAKTTLSAAQVIMVGDTPYDLAAARKAGVATIAFRCGGWRDEDFAGAIAVYDGPANLLEDFDSSPLADDHGMPDLLEEREQESTGKRILLLVGAAMMFVLGVIGWLLPVVTGIPFYVAGLVLLGMASKRFRTWVNEVERKVAPLMRFKVRRMLLKLPKGLRKMIRFPPDLARDSKPSAAPVAIGSGPSSPSATPARSPSDTPGRV